ncbi:MAG: type II secretion system protein [Bdellovibrionales bacterium]
MPMFHFIKKIKSQSGFSLIQAMVIAGILGTMAVVNLTVMNQQNRANKKNDDLAKAEGVTSQIRQLLRDPNRCRHFLGDLGDPATFGTPPGHPIDPNGDGSVDDGEQTVLQNTRAITSLSPSAQTAINPNLILFKVFGTYNANSEDVYNGLKIINFQTGPAPPGMAAPGVASLMVYYFPERSSSYLQGDMNVSGEIVIDYSHTGGVVTTCAAR